MSEDLRTKRTNKFLVKALIELLKTNSLENISVQDICDRAMVHRTTFYKHFADKYDLLGYFMDEIRQDIFDKASLLTLEKAKPKDVYLTLANIAFDYIDTHRDVMFSIMNCNNDDMVRGLFFETTERTIKSILKETQGELPIPINIVANFYTGGFISLAEWWLTNPKKYTKKQMMDFIDVLIDEKKL